MKSSQKEKRIPKGADLLLPEEETEGDACGVGGVCAGDGDGDGTGAGAGAGVGAGRFFGVY